MRSPPPWRARLTQFSESPRWLALQGAFRTHPPLFVLVTFLATLSAFAPTAFSLTIGALITTLSATADTNLSPSILVASLGLIFLAQQFLGSLESITADALARRYMGGVFRSIMRATLRPPTIRHLEDPELLDQVAKARNDGLSDPRAAVSGLIGWATERFRGAVALLLVAHFNPWLALLLASVWLHHLHRLQGLHGELIATRFRSSEDTRQVAYQVGVLTGATYAKEVRVFDLTRWFAQRYETSWLASMAGLWARRRAQVPLVILATLPILAAEALSLWLVGRAAVLGDIGLGAVVVYAHAIFESHRIGDVSEAEVQLQYGTAGIKPLRELQQLVETDSRLALSGTRPATNLPEREIRFENVTFRYPGETRFVGVGSSQERQCVGPNPYVFRNLTLTIPAGRSLALVGVNGAGKTTLISLLARLYDPTEGRILVDGVDLREIDPRDWQRRVAAIFQEFVKYELSAHDNIAVGAIERQHDRAAVIEAARRAGALELIESLPNGWDTILSRQYTGGADLSGGQWQRIALALFAASSGAPILIMDEPTAHLDVRAEARFYDSFLDLTHSLTTIVISHRFSTVRRADQIAVIDNGGVIEHGSHQSLLAAGGTYAHMFTLQAQRFTPTEPIA